MNWIEFEPLKARKTRKKGGTGTAFLNLRLFAERGEAARPKYNFTVMDQPGLISYQCLIFPEIHNSGLVRLISLRIPYFSADYQNLAPTARVFPIKQVKIKYVIAWNA